MKRFFQLTIAFLIPLLITLLLTLSILFCSKENFVDIDNFTKKKDGGRLIGYIYNEQNYTYLKFKSFCERDKVDVLVLGSSRVLQFREEMFNKPFFNAGYTIGEISDFNTFLNEIPETKLPKYLLIGLDQWMFNKTWNKLNRPKLSDDWSQNNSENIQSGLKAVSRFYKDLINRKIDLTNIFQNESANNIELIGLNALLNHTGFRNDGSMCYGKQIERLLKNDSVNYELVYKESFERIKKGRNRFEYGDEVDMEAISELDNFLSLCSLKGIKVFGIIQPYSNAVFSRMINNNNYKYINKLPTLINPIFNKYNYEIYSFNTANECSSNDAEMIDGFHGGEIVYLRLMINILSRNSDLNQVCDLKKLNNDLLKRKNRYLLYSIF